MSDNIVTTDLGMANELTMDEWCRTLVSQMFEMDNDTAVLEVVLAEEGAEVAPRVELKIELVAIDGKPTRGAVDE